MARENSVFGVTAGIYTVGIGASLAQLVLGAPGEIYSQIKYGSGGSLEIIGATGQILPTGTTNFNVPTAGTGYLLGNVVGATIGEIVEFNGAARYYLVATGATATAYFIKGLSQGF